MTNLVWPIFDITFGTIHLDTTPAIVHDIWSIHYPYAFGYRNYTKYSNIESVRNERSRVGLWRFMEM